MVPPGGATGKQKIGVLIPRGLVAHVAAKIIFEGGVAKCRVGRGYRIKSEQILFMQ